MASECLHVNARLEELREIPLNTSSSQTGASSMTVTAEKLWTMELNGVQYSGRKELQTEACYDNKYKNTKTEQE